MTTTRSPESSIAPALYMRPVGVDVAHLESGGLKVRDVHALREHHVRTELVGEEAVRVWRLYLVVGAMPFRQGRMGVDQILAVRPEATHRVPAVRTS